MKRKMFYLRALLLVQLLPILAAGFSLTTTARFSCGYSRVVGERQCHQQYAPQQPRFALVRPRGATVLSLLFANPNDSCKNDPDVSNESNKNNCADPNAHDKQKHSDHAKDDSSLHRAVHHHVEHRASEKGGIELSRLAAEKAIQFVEKGRAIDLGLERAAERFGERATERVGERAVERIGERAVERVGESVSERIGERAAERGLERAAEKIGEGAAERIAERAAERVGESVSERIGERAAERGLERAAEKIGEGAAERIAERAAERIGERGTERIGERVAEHGLERAGERIGERATARMGERSAERFGERAAERIGEHTVIAGRKSLNGVARPLALSIPERVALRIGRGLLIALPALGGVFALYLLKTDRARAGLERKRGSKLTSVLFGGAAATDAVDAICHFAIAYGVLRKFCHHKLAQLEEVSLGCAFFSTLCAVVGEIVTYTNRKKR